MFYKRVILWKKEHYTKEMKLSSVQGFLARHASFGQLGYICDPQISSKLQNGINDPKRLENKICTIMKDRKTFYGDHMLPITSCSNVQYVLYKGDPLEARNTHSKELKTVESLSFLGHLAPRL